MLKLQANGLQEIIDKFDKLAKDTQNQVQVALNDFGNRVVKDAKTTVSNKSSDFGLLQNKISSTPGNGDVTIVADTKYAAYVEFGTRKFAASYVASLPSDWQTFAASFKGPMSGGGGLKDMWENIKTWGDRKGLDRSHSYFIYKKILEDGSKQHPFLYPAIQKNIPILEQDIKDIF